MTSRPSGLGLRRLPFDAEHEAFRASARAFLAREVVPRRCEWEAAGKPDRDFWRRAAEAGFLGFEIDTTSGGRGVADFRFNAVLNEEVGRVGGVGAGLVLQNDIVMPYMSDLASAEQAEEWLPRVASGDLLPALAVAEPHAGSDLRAMTTCARAEGDHYVITGDKSFVSCGTQADLLIVATRTSEDPAGCTLLVVESDLDRVTRQAQRNAIGLHALGLASVRFDEVRVPMRNRLGAEGTGFGHLLRHHPREWLSIAIASAAAAAHALEITLGYVRERRAFGRPIGNFQANRFVLAEAATELAALTVYLDRCIEAHTVGELTPAEAAGVKSHASDLQFQVLDCCLQLHGGHGYAGEGLISNLWRDARAQRIYGGANEVMRDIVGRSLGL